MRSVRAGCGGTQEPSAPYPQINDPICNSIAIVPGLVLPRANGARPSKPR